MRDDTCFSCSNLIFYPDRLYPYKCRKNKAWSYGTMLALMRANGIDILDCAAKCKNFKSKFDEVADDSRH